MKTGLKKIKLQLREFFWRTSSLTVEKKVPAQWYGNVNAGFFVHDAKLNSESIVYSFGVGEDVSFDLALIEKFGCKVFAFDPTPKSIQFVKEKVQSPNFNFFPYGLYSHNGTLKFYLPENPDYVSGTTYNRWGYSELEIAPIEVPVKKFTTILHELDHEKIDILKLDIEGSEYEVIEEILLHSHRISQLMIEFHHRFENLGLEQTQEAVEKIVKKGFDLIRISDNHEEYTFLRRED